MVLVLITIIFSVFRSMVQQDAALLEAFGKGASEDIRLSKSELYAQMTWDPTSNVSLFAEPQLTTPLPSPPLSPRNPARGSLSGLNLNLANP